MMEHPGRSLNALFVLLRAGLWGTLDTPSAFPLSDGEWEQVFLLSRRQTVTGIVFRGFGCLPDDAMPPMGLVAKWMAHIDRIEEQNRRMNMLLKRLVRHLEDNGVQAVLQKGQGIASMYPEPLLRECGDIDLYFPDMKEAASLEAFAGSPGRKMPDGSIEYVVDGIVIECHGRLVDIYSPFKRKYLRSLVKSVGFERVTIGDGDDVIEVDVPAPEVNMLMLGSHIMKHATGVGIGLRQLCDYAVAYRHYAGKMEPERMEEVCRKAGIGRWMELLDAFVSEWICPSRKSEGALEVPQMAKKSRILLQIILKGGNFGTFTDGRENASRSVLARKWDTFTSYMGNLRFAWSCAPGEWFWVMMRLFGGQFG